MRCSPHFTKLPVRLGAALAALGVLSLAACAPAAPSAPETRDGGVLVYATGDAEPACLDPHVGGNYPQALVATQFLEPLFGRDDKGQIVPWLATEWKAAADGLSWDITLRDDVKFTDGTPFDAEAVAANIAHIQDPKTQSSTGFVALKKVTKVTAIDPTHVRFTLSAPDSALPESLSQHWIAMESPAGLKRGMEENCKAPIGTGPFKVESRVQQEKITLVRNDDYVSTSPEADHSGPAHLDGIEWRYIPDAATRQAALASGEVNVIDNPLPADIAAAKGAGFTHIDAPRPGSVNRIELNSGQTPFDDIRVREAFVRAADPGPGIETLFHGTAKRSFSPLASTEPFGISDESLFKTDPKAAERLLDEAGWKTKGADGVRTKDGKRLTVRIPVSTNQSNAAEQSLFEQIQANTGKVGFELKLNPVDLPSWHKALSAKEYEAVSAPYTKVGPDVLRTLYHSANITPAPSGYFANHAQISDPKIDALLVDAATNADPAKRKAAAANAQKLVMESFVILPLYDQQNHFLVNGATGVTSLGTIATPTMINAKLTK
ncbi:ABC transporter substrate-binding protein [Leucobacter sp. CSA2]|uniref:ABC transporter substrate-binding protein n=1 Tax=Leucobacter edaphi TaxID=2796472 RepID=A0A934QFK6_9MICO|nr:ABC transporter substrate-binding protein [Leucobacter edaphi]MBK0422617.1 ABC transporter substrate-binding protein [Leucobacter edaphi]